MRLRSNSLALRVVAAGLVVGGGFAAVLTPGCGTSVAADAPQPAPDAASRPVSTRDPADVPVDGLSDAELADFQEGDALFGTPLRDADGLGPVYIRTSCAACHMGAARGPGFVTKFGVVDPSGAPVATSPLLAFGHTERPFAAGSGETPLLAPTDPSVRVSRRLGPAVFAMGYLEAITDAAILTQESMQSAGVSSVRGRANRVTYNAAGNADGRFHGYKAGDAVLGRFGLKARIGTVDEFTADAMQGDMGITSPLRPAELPNPDGLTDDARPGVDVAMPSLTLRANYMRAIAIPRRVEDPAGAALFARVGCATCHVPGMAVRADYPVRAIAAGPARVYSDLLLHDMGEGLSDHLPVGVDGTATAREWRTAPLVGLRFNRSYLHDGRALTVEAAIAAHAGEGSQGDVAGAAFAALGAGERAALLRFVEGL